MNDEFEQFLFRVPLADRFPADVAEPGVLEHRGVDFFDGQHRVVELGVAHDVEAACFGRHDFSQALEMQFDVVEVAMHVLAQQWMLLRNRRDDVVEMRVSHVAVGRFPIREIARRTAPGAADRLPIQLAGLSAAFQKPSQYM